MSRGELVVVLRPPPDCDFAGVWEVIEERPLAGGDSHLRLRQGNSYIGMRRSNVRAATQDDIAAGRSRPVLTDARDLDWDAARQAAERITRICQGAGFKAPELLHDHRENVVLVCEQLNAIVAALKITPPGATP